MNWRGKSKTNWRAISLATLPLILLVITWKVREELEPITVELKGEKIRSRALFERLNIEVRKHPYASTIAVSWSQPWLKESGLDLSFSQSLRWSRSEETLFYSTEQCGWAYNHAEKSGLEVLANSHLPKDPITLPASVHAQLRARGWTLTEHYLP